MSDQSNKSGPLPIHTNTPVFCTDMLEPGHTVSLGRSLSDGKLHDLHDKNNGLELEDKAMLQDSVEVEIHDSSSPLQLQYGLLSSPPVLVTLMAALQVSL